METVVRNVGDLVGSDRSTLERVVGHVLKADDQLIIQVMSPAPANPKAQPESSISELPDWTDVFQGMSDSEAAALGVEIQQRADLSRSFVDNT